MSDEVFLDTAPNPGESFDDHKKRAEREAMSNDLLSREAFDKALRGIAEVYELEVEEIHRDPLCWDRLVADVVAHDEALRERLEEAVKERDELREAMPRGEFCRNCDRYVDVIASGDDAQSLATREREALTSPEEPDAS